MSKKTIFEKIVTGALLASATMSIAAVIFISLFLFYRGLPLLKNVSIAEFLFSSKWEPTGQNPSYGILSFIIGSFYVTSLSLIIAVPVGISAGAYLAELSKEKYGRFVRSAVELLAGVPSVVYGLFGIALITKMSRTLFGGSGYNIASASIVLAIMILPTIINVTEVSLRSVNPMLKENSLALGATRWQTLRSVLMPAANKGIIAGVVLAMGRAMGETMAVLMVGGNAPIMPKHLNGMVRTLTMNIITDMSYATGDHLTSLFSTGIVLFVFIVVLNLSVQLILKKSMAMK